MLRRIVCCVGGGGGVGVGLLGDVGVGGGIGGWRLEGGWVGGDDGLGPDDSGADVGVSEGGCIPSAV